MPRKGAGRGERSMRWAVDVTPAEWALVEAVRAGDGRATWLVAAARGAIGRASTVDGVDVAWLAQAVAALRLVDAEARVLDELATDREEETGRDRFGRGGRKPTPRLMTAEEVAAAHAAMRNDPRLAERLTEALADVTDDDA